MPLIPRVCLLTESFYPVLGGAEIQAELLSERLIENGVELFVITGRTTPDLKRFEQVGRIPVLRVLPSGLSRVSKYGMIMPAFIHLVKNRHRYEVIYVCNYNVLGVVAVLASLILHKKCILKAETNGEISGDIFRNGLGFNTSKLLSKALDTAIEIRNLILRRANLFIAISEEIKKELIRCKVKPKQIAHIPNGVDTDRFHPVDHEEKRRLRDKLGIPPQKAVIIYSGRLNRGKGLELLLDAWRRVSEFHSDAHLLVVGSATPPSLSCEEEIKGFVFENNLSSSVTFTGFVNNVHEYLQASDILILPSLNEAFSCVIPEAFACSLPVIATSVGGNKDIIVDGTNGLLIEPNDVDAIIRAINWFLENRVTAANMGANGRSLVESKYNLESLGKKYLSVLSSLV